jgi:transcriptional regulator with XRE-family HTH domain
METNSKALLAQGKALPGPCEDADNKAMLSTAEALKLKLAEVLNGGLTQRDIAATCGVSKQAVQGWKNTGRIDKKHLPGLAKVSGKPLAWWLDYTDAPAPTPASNVQQHSAQACTAREVSTSYTASRWPFSTITPTEYAQLESEQQKLVEGFVRGLIAEAARNKSETAPRAA